MLNNVSHALESEVLENQINVPIKPEVFLGTLNTIVMTANALESGAETAPDVSEACGKRVGSESDTSLIDRTSFCLKFEREYDLYDAQALGAYVNTVKFTGYVYADKNPTNVFKLASKI